MKSISIKTNIFLAAWLLCTGILLFVYFGLYAFPNDMANKAYMLGWLASTNALLTVLLQSSRIALVTLVLGWLVALVLAFFEIGVIPSEYTIVFAVLLVSTQLAVEQSYVHIASFGGVAKEEAEPGYAITENKGIDWPSTQFHGNRVFKKHGAYENDDLTAMRHRAMDSPDLLAQVPGRSYTKTP